MKICIVSYAGSIHTQKWINCFHNKGYEVHVITPVLASFENISIPHSNVHQYADRGGRCGLVTQLQNAYQVVRIAKALNADITHVHSLFFVHPLFFWLWNLVLGPVNNLFISTWGSDIVPNPPAVRLSFFDRFAKRLQLSQALVITATSDYLARLTSLVADGASVSVIPFGVDCDVFTPSRKSEHSGIRLCFIKHLSKKYGPGHLLRALRIVCDRFPDTTLTLAGAGPMQAELCALTQELRLERSVKFAGDVPNTRVPEMLADSDIFVMPSVFNSETFGVAAVEAQAMGIPVVATNVGGVPEAVVDGETGILVQPGNPQELASAIIRLIAAPPLRVQMGIAGRNFVLKKYNFSDNAAAMETLYKEAIYAGSKRNA